MCDIVPGRFSSIIKGGLRSIAASFPVLASFGQAWNEYETGRTGERIQELFDNMQREFDGLSQRLDIDEDLIAQSLDQFPALLERTIDAVRREAREQKRQYFARLLIRVAADSQRSFDAKMTLIESLESLCPLDLDVLRLFCASATPSIREIAWRDVELPGEDDNAKLKHLACSVSKLVARGLLLITQTSSGVVFPPHGLAEWLARWQETHYMVLPAGRELLDVLE